MLANVALTADGWAAGRRHPGDAVEVFTVADSLDPVRCAKGLRVLPDTTWEGGGDLDVLVYPGGVGTRREMSRTISVNWTVCRAHRPGSEPIADRR